MGWGARGSGNLPEVFESLAQGLAAMADAVLDLQRQFGQRLAVLGNEEQGVVAEAAVAAGLRITSYNVCYTKLLRQPPAAKTAVSSRARSMKIRSTLFTM